MWKTSAKHAGYLQEGETELQKRSFHLAVLNVPEVNRDSCPLDILFKTVEVQNAAEPMGEPRRTNQFTEKGTPAGSEKEGMDTPGGIKMSDLLRLRCSPREGPSSLVMLRACQREIRGPQRVPSSRYPTFRRRFGTSHLIRSMTGCKTREKLRGPRGSPC